MKTSEILKEAEKHLWDGKWKVGPRESEFICWAIDYAFDRERYYKKSLVKELICKRIDGSSYSDWAYRNGHLPPGWYINEKYWDPIIQANRLNWLRELQREFREKGD